MLLMSPPQGYRPMVSNLLYTGFTGTAFCLWSSLSTSTFSSSLLLNHHLSSFWPWEKQGKTSMSAPLLIPVFCSTRATAKSLGPALTQTTAALQWDQRMVHRRGEGRSVGQKSLSVAPAASVWQALRGPVVSFYQHIYSNISFCVGTSLWLWATTTHCCSPQTI